MSLGTSVLIIDDSRDYCLLLERAFRHQAPGLGVFLLHDGAQAIEHLQACGGTRPVPGLVLLDRLMPGGLDGYDVLQAARALPTLAAVPIWMLSASHEEEQVELARELGVDGYLGKPAGDRCPELVGRILARQPWCRQELVRESCAGQIVPVPAVDSRVVHVNRAQAGPYPGGHLNYAAEIAQLPLAFALDTQIKDHGVWEKRRNFVRVLFLLGWTKPEFKLYMPRVSERWLEEQAGKPVQDLCAVRALALK